MSPTHVRCHGMLGVAVLNGFPLVLQQWAWDDHCPKHCTLYHALHLGPHLGISFRLLLAPHGVSFAIVFYHRCFTVNQPSHQPLAFCKPQPQRWCVRQVEDGNGELRGFLTYSWSLVWGVLWYLSGPPWGTSQKGDREKSVFLSFIRMLSLMDSTVMLC